MLKWWRKRKQQRDCFHHRLPSITGLSDFPAESWIKSQLIETGKAKMFWCVECDKTWIT